jgi:hypothetical protein
MALLVLGGIALVGALLAFLVASPARRGWLVVWLGGLLAIAFVFMGWTRASADGLACHDCDRFLGRYWQWSIYVFFACVGWFVWSLGVAAGTALRAAFLARRELREQRGAA